jgi:hypothetical protein
MRELREDILHPVCAIRGQVLMSRVQAQVGSSRKRKGIRRSKSLLGNEEKEGARLLIASSDTAGRNGTVAATRLFRAIPVDIF